MKTYTDKYQKQLSNLIIQGGLLLNAMQDTHYPEKMENFFNEVLKKDYSSFKKSLPSFYKSYQPWYNDALNVIKVVLPDRLLDFRRLYEASSTRKEIKSENYVIEDYLKNITVLGGYENKKIIASPVDAIPQFEIQLNILKSVENHFENSLSNVMQRLQMDFFDAELTSASILAKNNFLRPAGIVCGLVLKKHLHSICIAHSIKSTKKEPSIQDCSNMLNKAGISDLPTLRLIQLCNEISIKCEKEKKNEPTFEEIRILINSVDQIIKMLF